MRIRIIDVPPGEAPEEVRRAWVGLVLPLPRNIANPRYGLGFGVLSGPKSILGLLWKSLAARDPRRAIYLVRVLDAIEALEESDSHAAAWWKDNAPHLIRPGRCFGFPVEVCEELED